jgi:hypothetical protein
MNRWVQTLAAAVLLLGWVGAARADLVYTWNDDSKSGLTGSFTVNSNVLAAGKITAADILSYSFTAPTITLPGIITIVSPTFTNADSTPIISNNDLSASIPINSSGGFTAPLGTDFLNLASKTLTVLGSPLELTLETDRNFSVPGGEGWFDSNFVAIFQTGNGHWSVPSPPPAGIPEPPTFALLATGLLSLAGYGWRRWKMLIAAH